MKRVAIVTGFLVLGSLAMIFVIRAGLNPVLSVQLVDGGGIPIADALVTPDGIRGADGGHYGWNAKGRHAGSEMRPVKTDANGRAKIRYPRFITERVRSIEISFAIEHPDFCAERPFLKVGSPLNSRTPFLVRLEYMWKDLQLQGKVQKVVMKPGAVIEVSGTLNGAPVPAEELRAEVVSADGIFPSGSFRETGSKIVSRKLPKGGFIVRAIHMPKEGAPQFSEPEEAVAVLGATNTFKLRLKPGHKVHGKLEEVLGPVKNGWVNARIVNNRSSGSQDPLVWAEFAPVNLDGSFLLQNLPAGRLELVALCDGYLSRNPTNWGSFVLPITWPLNEDLEVSVAMQPSATADIRLTNGDGQPLANVEVVFWPNIQWATLWSTVFASDFYRSLEVLHGRQFVSTESQKRSFSAKTDRNGRALIKEVPPFSLPLSIVDESYELPLKGNSHESTINLIEGQTNYATLKLQKKGMQQRE